MAGKRVYEMLSKATSRFLDDDCTTMAAALAYYTTFSIAPLLLIIISIVGLIFGRAAVQEEIQSQIQGLIGEGAARQVGAMVESAGRHSSTGVWGAALGGLALIVGASGAFTQLQTSLNRIWHVRPDPRVGGVRNLIGQRILALEIVAALAFLLLVSLAFSAAIAASERYIWQFLPQWLSGAILEVIGSIVTLAILSVLFAAMFKVLPDARIEWRDVWTGAGITALLFTTGKVLIGMYLGHSVTKNAYGAAGSFVLIVLWAYYSSIVFLAGAELTAVWSETHSGPPIPKKGAVRVNLEEKIEPTHAAR